MVRLIASVVLPYAVLAAPQDDDDVRLMQTHVRQRLSKDVADGDASSESSVPEASDILAIVGAGGSPAVASMMVEKLARHSVDANATIDDDTKTALQSLREMIVSTEQENIKQAHQDDQNFLDSQLSTIEQCGTVLSANQVEDAVEQGEIDTKKSTHANCRNELATLLTDRDTKCDALASFEEGLTVPSCAKPGHDTMGTWLHGNAAWYTTAHATWTELNDACEAARTAYITKDTACDINQASYETDFCTFRVQVHSTCTTYEGCYNTAVDTYENEQTAVVIRERTRKIDYTATEKIKCYIDVLLSDDDNDARATKLQECQALCVPADDGSNACEDHLNINYHTLPDEQTCSRSAVSAYPCIDSFLADYAGFVDLRDCAACPELPAHLAEPGKTTHDPWQWEHNTFVPSCESSAWNLPQELDGNSGSRSGCNNWYTLDLGEVKSVKETYIEWEACQCDAAHSGPVRLYSSEDGATYLPYYTQEFYQWGGHTTKTYRAPVTGRYFRVERPSRAGTLWMSMWEYRLVPQPDTAIVFPEVQVVMVNDESLNLQQMQDKCPQGYGLVKLQSAEHIRHLAVKLEQAGGDHAKSCGAAIASKVSHNPNIYKTLGTTETDVTAFFQEVYDSHEFGGDWMTHQGDQGIAGFGWGSWTGGMNGADKRQIHDFSTHCQQAVFCEAQR